ncbi:MAG: Asp-tRNA(Asn)/Glu-tRNA(Gln) amidotransferase subunit GatA [Porcipelethomonas sp.]
MRLCENRAFELSEMLRRKQCSAGEICEDVLNKIKETDSKIGAYVTVTEELARKNAAAVDSALASGEELHPLAGIPIAVKDNISTKGIKTTCCSKMLENYIPPFNAAVTEKICAAGMTIVGKTNMDEFAMGSSTEKSFFHPTRNPNNTDYVPGGSSGGSAAAAAADSTILGLGSDTGGSVRQPAAYCGVVGLKPTYGSVSRYGLVAFASSFDQIGPIGKCVRDTAMLLSLICGHDKRDSTSVKRNHPDYAAALSDDIKGLRIGIPSEYFGDNVEDSVRMCVINAVKEYEKKGAVIKEISIPSAEYVVSAYYIISSAEASSNLSRFDGVKYGFRAGEYGGISDMTAKTRGEGFGEEVKRRILLGTFVLSSGYYEAYYSRAKKIQNLICRDFSDALEDVDVIVSPASPVPAYKIGEYIDQPTKMYRNDIFTVTANITGLPAVSVPCGTDRNGLPVGLQLMGGRFCEQTVLNAAYACEKIIGGKYEEI